ncbi:MAG: hypothetical protein ABI783_02215, partial [Actinomycetota bacterium]
ARQRRGGLQAHVRTSAGAPGLLPYLSARRTRAVHLVRENALDQVVSWETSVARGLFRAHSAERVHDIAVRIDIAALE